MSVGVFASFAGDGSVACHGASIAAPSGITDGNGRASASV
jgi:hypothetical protein